jgi:pimeloyl-ACP methyl ester carboxylesterase
MSQFLTKNRFKAIRVSRPGYLGTPLNLADPSIDHEGDLLAEILDAVGVERAGVLAYSGGGPSAYRLAVRHPDRVSAIVAIAAVSSRYVAPEPTATDRLLFGTRAGQRLLGFLARRAPGQVIGEALASEGSIRGEELKTATAGVMADPEQRATVLALSTTTAWRGSRKAGWDNDLKNFGAIDSLELDRVHCPVLLIHGDADTDVTIDYSHTAHSARPDSTLVAMKRGTHLALTRARWRACLMTIGQATSPPSGRWSAPLRSGNRRDRGCSNGSRTGAVSAGSGTGRPGRSRWHTPPGCP